MRVPAEAIGVAAGLLAGWGGLGSLALSIITRLASSGAEALDQFGDRAAPAGLVFSLILGVLSWSALWAALGAASVRGSRLAGAAAIVGGLLGVIVGPVMVIVKYMTGWAVVPEPAWIPAAKPALGSLLSFATPVGLWVFYGRIYTAALLLMLAGVVALAIRIRRREGRIRPAGLWVLIAGLCLVIPGDAVHTATWHQNGLMVPTPGTNPLANTAYAIHMMGMNVILIGCVMTGVSALRHRIFAPWLAWLFLLVPPSAIGLSLTLLPTTPGGGLWMFSVLMIAAGSALAFGRPRWLAAA